MPDGRTIISTGQLEHFKIIVNEKSKTITGKTPSIVTLEGYEIPISTRQGLPYIKLRPFSSDEASTLPHITLTSPHPWDPTALDAHVEDDWYHKEPIPSSYSAEMPFDSGGRLHAQPDIDDDESDQEDRHYQAVDRAGIKAFCAHLIRDEIQRKFYVCNIEGRLQDVRWNDKWYHPDSESDSEPPVASTSTSHSKSTELNDKEDVSDAEDVPPLLQRSQSDSSDDDPDEEETPRRGATGRARRQAMNLDMWRPPMDSDNESSDDEATPPPLSQRPIRDSDSDSSDSEDSDCKARTRPRRKIKVSTRSSTRKRGEVQPQPSPKAPADEAKPKDKSPGRKGKKVSKKKGSGSRTGKKKRKTRYDDGQGSELRDEPDPHPEKN
ncbi:MAG: hypothetical protein LC687_03505, partial [Actinobacteria bacterium]|nr:hypothetical protein [Actinomycetota bacterium]